MTFTDYLVDQRALQDLMDRPMGQAIDSIEPNIQALIVEAVELLNETNWKPWRKTKITMSRDAACNEIVDIFKFAFNLADAVGLTEAKFDELWKTTNAKLIQRIKDGY